MLHKALKKIIVIMMQIHSSWLKVFLKRILWNALNAWSRSNDNSDWYKRKRHKRKRHIWKCFVPSKNSFLLPPPPNPHTPAFKKMENPLRILISNEGKHSLTLISFGRVSPVLTMWNEQNSRDATSSTTTIANVNKNNAQNKCGPHLFDQVLWWGSYV